LLHRQQLYIPKELPGSNRLSSVNTTHFKSLRKKQKLHEPEPGFSTHGRKHVGVASDLLQVLLSRRK
jgi:hypothetical protein